ncbi:MAG TPA: acyl-CoA desaturase [Burkholderiales bacterium]
MTSYGIQKTESIKVIRIRLVVVHAGALAAFFMPFDWALVALLAATWFPRMFGVEAGYHRYFAHRAFKTSRIFQFLLAALGASSGQRGALWWAAHHRGHHRHSDQAGDLHSPREGFWHAHLGWLIDEKNVDTDLDAIPDFARYPELRWLNKFYHVPMLLLLAGLALGGANGWFGPNVSGWSAVLWGFFLSTAGVLHATLAVNSIAHLRGRLGGYRRYATEDGSVNHAWLAIPTTGAAWHNNHHRYGAAARAGFAWWEVDLSYLGLKLLEACRLVWDLREVPAEVMAEGGLGETERERAIA